MDIECPFCGDVVTVRNNKCPECGFNIVKNWVCDCCSEIKDERHEKIQNFFVEVVCEDCYTESLGEIN